jgi:hypothetical protein
MNRLKMGCLMPDADCLMPCLTKNAFPPIDLGRKTTLPRYHPHSPATRRTPWTLTRSPRRALRRPSDPSNPRLPAEGPCLAGGAHSFRTLSGPASETRTNRSPPVTRIVQTNAISIAQPFGICKSFFALPGNKRRFRAFPIASGVCKKCMM